MTMVTWEISLEREVNGAMVKKKKKKIESMDMCIGRRDISDVVLKTTLNIIKINESIEIFRFKG